MIVTQAFLGQLAGILALLAYPVYIRGITAGKTRPNRATWWILTLAASVLAASYYAEGARDTMWIAVAYIFGNLAIAVLSLRYGYGSWTRADKACLAAAIGSAILWWFLDAPGVALSATIVIDFFGILPTVYKSYNKPSTESAAAWFIDGISSIINMFAIGTWTFAIAAYPLYLLVTNCLIAYLVLRAKKRI